MAPHLYRADGARGGERPAAAAAPAHDPILFGELLPIGKPIARAEAQPPAAEFLRAFFRGQAAQRPRRLRLPPLHAPRRPAEPGADRRTTPRSARSAACCTVLDQARAQRQAHVEEEAADLEHRVRLPDEPARPASAPGSPAVPRSGRISELWFSYSNRRVKSISQYTMDDQPRPGEPVAERPAVRQRRASSRTSTRTTACRSSCASSARARSRCAARPARAAPARRSRSSSAGRKGPFKPLGGADRRAQRARLLRGPRPASRRRASGPSTSRRAASRACKVKPVRIF